MFGRRKQKEEPVVLDREDLLQFIRETQIVPHAAPPKAASLTKPYHVQFQKWPSSDKYSDRENADLREYVDSRAIERTFVDELRTLLAKCDRPNREIYKAAGMDRKLFSKIINTRTYKPGKDTCIALALGLHLPYEQALDLISKAGYALSAYDKRDVIIEYFFRRGIYSLDALNEALFDFHLKTLN